MPELVSPKQVARAIGVSESSLKRWCDKGLIDAHRTAGGHRRMRIDEVIQFVRTQNFQLAQPELLGLPATTGRSTWTLDRACEKLREALVAGEEDVCRQIVLDVYLAQQPLSIICDQVIAAAFHRIGELWQCREVEVYEERRSCEICLRLVHELRHLVRQPPADGPTALGATLDGDPYTLAVSMGELVLREAGWNAASLGHMLPFETLQTAIRRHKPKLFWLSVSSIREADRFSAEMAKLAQVARRQTTRLVAGGRALTPEVRKSLAGWTVCDTFEQLAALARTLHHPAD